MEQIKSFTKGLNMDVNYKFTPEEVYIDAHNIRLISDVNQGSIGINNIKGNKYLINIPDTPLIQKLTIVGNGFTNVTINGQTGAGFNAANSTPEDLYNYIKNSGAYTNLGIEYNIYYGTLYVLIIPINNTSVTISTLNSILLLDDNYIEPQEDLQIIGSTNIRNDIYLFTTNNTDKNPLDSVGQIWKYTYDKITFSSTLELKYIGYLNFSTYWCITPTAALGRYENSNIQRIYWTDNFNRLRSLNVADLQSLAIPLNILDIKSSVNFDIPLLQSVRGVGNNNIKGGAYQIAYRLKSNTNELTKFSELSNLTSTYNQDLYGTWKDLAGTNDNNYCNQAITWNINNLDRQYDRIEVALIYRKSISATPQVYIIVDDILDNDSYTVTYNNVDQQVGEISINEFLALSGIFTHCKTIATKDNRLFVANIRNEQSDINYDARAYRFPQNSSQTYLNNNGVNVSYNLNIPADYSSIGEKEDVVNPSNYYTSNTNYIPDQFYRNSSNILGGDGLNISYEFCTFAVIEESSNNGFIIPSGTGAAWSIPNANYYNSELSQNINSITNNNIFSSQLYPTWYNNPANDGLKNPNVRSVLKGFQRNEVYRFGIQFFDKSGNPYFTKWIGDIKMPDYSDDNVNAYWEEGIQFGENIIPNSFYPNSISDSGKDFRQTITGVRPGDPDNYIQCFTQVLGIKFEIRNLNDIKEDISGYSIVRVKRDNPDKRIISEGYIQGIKFGSENYYRSTSISYSESPKLGFFVTPDFFMPNSTQAPSPGMKIEIPYRLVGYDSWVDNVLTAKVAKRYVIANYGSNKYDIDKVAYADYFQQNINIPGSTSAPLPICNNTSLGGVNFPSGGSTAWLFNVTSDISEYDLSDKLSYARVTAEPINQYGGDTYNARSNNEYILCSNFTPIRDNIYIPDTNPIIFGGDTYINLYDSTALNFNRDNSGDKYALVIYFGVSSSVNTRMASAYSANRFASTDFMSSDSLGQTYTYGDYHSCENDVKTFFPKPEPFIENEEFDNRFYCSNIKINGELTDSWKVFNSTNYWDVEGIYGPIQSIDILRDKLYFWQTKAFGLMQVNPRAVVTDVNNTINSELQLGTGLPLQRHDYISTEIGLQHQWGVTKSSNKLFWIDVFNKKFFSFGEGQGLNIESDVKGLFSYLTKNLKNNILKIDKPVYEDDELGLNGIRAVYDFKYNEAIFTVTDSLNASSINKYTFTFNDLLNCFTSFVDYTPKIYFTDGYKIFSTDTENLNKIYIHDEGEFGNFYNILYPSKIKFPVNKDPLITKVFDNIYWNSQALNNDVNQFNNTWTKYRIYNDYQNTDWQSLVMDTNIKNRERTYKTFIPRNRVNNTGNQSPDIFNPANLAVKEFGDRIRDKYCVIDLEYNNYDNYQLITDNVIVEFRQSAR